MRVFEQSISGEEAVSFLQHVLREVSGKLTTVWDGLPAHRGQTVREFLAEGASRLLHLEQLPGYAPDLNPDVGVWNYLKNVEMNPDGRRDAVGASITSKPNSAKRRSGFATRPRSSRAFSERSDWFEYFLTDR